jgi:hypothetical protein
MKLTKTQLKRIIQEELQKVLQEQDFETPFSPPTGWGSEREPHRWVATDPGIVGAQHKIEGQRRSAVQRRNAALVQQQRNKARQARILARARKIAKENPGISFEQALERARGSVEVAPAPVEASTSMTEEEYERTHGEGSVKAANPCPPGQKQIGQRNDGSALCG